MRERDLITVTGMKGVGKTWRTAREVESYVMDDPGIARTGQRVLIFDTNVEPEWSKYKTLEYDCEEKDEFKRGEHVRNFAQKTVRRIIPYKKNGRPMSITEMVETVFTVANHFEDGLLILEDFNRYLSRTDDDEIISLLCTLRHKQVDLILHLQSLSPVTTRMWQNTTYVRFHKQSDEIDRYKNRIPFELMKIAELTIDRHYRYNDIRYFLYVSPTEKKIIGITEEDFVESCKEYLSMYSKEVNNLMKRENEDGSNKFSTKAEATNYWIEGKKYYIQPAQGNA